MTSPSLEFAEYVRHAAAVARELGLTVPGFRAPPRDPRATRTIRIHPEGATTVAIRVAGRPSIDVLLDIVDGIAATNDIGPGHRDITRLRTEVLIRTGLAGQRRTA